MACYLTFVFLFGSTLCVAAAQLYFQNAESTRTVAEATFDKTTANGTTKIQPASILPTNVDNTANLHLSLYRGSPNYETKNGFRPLRGLHSKDISITRETHTHANEFPPQQQTEDSDSFQRLNYHRSNEFDRQATRSDSHTRWLPTVVDHSSHVEKFGTAESESELNMDVKGRKIEEKVTFQIPSTIGYDRVKHNATQTWQKVLNSSANFNKNIRSFPEVNTNQKRSESNKFRPEFIRTPINNVTTHNEENEGQSGPSVVKAELLSVYAYANPSEPTGLGRNQQGETVAAGYQHLRKQLENMALKQNITEHSYALLSQDDSPNPKAVSLYSPKRNNIALPRTQLNSSITRRHELLQDTILDDTNHNIETVPLSSTEHQNLSKIPYNLLDEASIKQPASDIKGKKQKELLNSVFNNRKFQAPFDQPFSGHRSNLSEPVPRILFRLLPVPINNINQHKFWNSSKRNAETNDMESENINKTRKQNSKPLFSLNREYQYLSEASEIAPYTLDLLPEPSEQRDYNSEVSVSGKEPTNKKSYSYFYQYLDYTPKKGKHISVIKHPYPYDSMLDDKKFSVIKKIVENSPSVTAPSIPIVPKPQLLNAVLGGHNDITEGNFTDPESIFADSQVKGNTKTGLDAVFPLNTNETASNESAIPTVAEIQYTEYSDISSNNTDDSLLLVNNTMYHDTISSQNKDDSIANIPNVTNTLNNNPVGGINKYNNLNQYDLPSSSRFAFDYPELLTPSFGSENPNLSRSLPAFARIIQPKQNPTHFDFSSISSTPVLTNVDVGQPTFGSSNLNFDYLRLLSGGVNNLAQSSKQPDINIPILPVATNPLSSTSISNPLLTDKSDVAGNPLISLLLKQFTARNPLIQNSLTAASTQLGFPTTGFNIGNGVPSASQTSAAPLGSLTTTVDRKINGT